MDKSTSPQPAANAAQPTARDTRDTPDRPPPASPQTATHSAAHTAAPAAAPAAGDALSTMQQVIELADGLSTIADRLHERIQAEIRRHPEGAVPEQVQAAMRALFDDEQLLRQRAGTLYADAAAYIVRGLGQPQAHLIALTTDAAEKIRRIGAIGAAIGLVGGVLSLAGAVASGQPAPIVQALENIRLHGAALDALAPADPGAVA